MAANIMSLLLPNLIMLIAICLKYISHSVFVLVNCTPSLVLNWIGSGFYWVEPSVWTIFGLSFLIVDVYIPCICLSNYGYSYGDICYLVLCQ